MRSLGENCALMHKSFRAIPCEGVKGYPLNPVEIMKSLSAHYKNAATAESASEEYRFTIALLGGLLYDLPDDFPCRFRQSVCHEDFSADNMLFHADRLSVFLDFDRNQYSFPAHDIGRVLLSLTLNENRMDAEKVKAFICGYNCHIPLTAQETADALRLTLCIETPWWLYPACFERPSLKPRRFAYEMRWLAENWPILDNLLAN